MRAPRLYVEWAQKRGLVAMANSTYFDLAIALTRKYDKDIRDAEKAGKKARIKHVRATSRALIEQSRVASLSMNDIIDAAKAEGLLTDPLIRQKLVNAASILNSEFDRFDN